MSLDAVGNLRTNNGSISTALNITAATVVKATPGRCVCISVLVAGSAGAAYDSASTAGTSAANKFFTIPAAVGVSWIDWPCSTGIVVQPGSGQTVAVSFA